MWQVALSKLFKVREKVALNLSKGDEEKPFLDHLEDLRKMFVRIAITVISAILLTFGFNKQLMNVILQPYVWSMNGAELNINATNAEAAAKSVAENPATPETPNATTPPATTPEPSLSERPPFKWEMPGTRTPQEGFMASVNVSLVAAVIISFPLLLFFILQFVLPGLRDNERKILWPAMGIGFGLFLTGICFSYYSVLPRALQFFIEWNYDHGFENLWMLGDYIMFSTRFILIFGVSFELPVVVMALVKLDFLSYKVMTGTRRHAIIGICIFSAVITPTQDVLTLLLLAGPLYVLYEICIWLAYFLEKKERQMYPEFYAEQDKDEAELEKEVDEWDKDGYTPWFSDAEDEDIEDEYQQRAKTGDKTDAKNAADGETATADAEGAPQDESSTKPESEPSLEELARRDELGGNPDETKDAEGDPAKNQD